MLVHSVLVFVILASSSVLGLQPDVPRVETRIENNFPLSANFISHIHSSHPVSRAGLFIRHNHSGETDAFIADLEFSSLDTIASVPLEDGYLQPFELITYWWQIDLTDGNSIHTEPINWVFEDPGQNWQDLSSEGVTVLWTGGDQAFGKAFLSLAEDSFQRVQSALALPSTSPIWIYLYPSVSELQSVLGTHGHHWIGGVVPDTGFVILVAAGADPNSLVELERTIPHEFTHVLLQYRLGDAYANLPAWLVEGLAGTMEGSPDAALQITFDNALENNELLPIESLCSTFPIDSVGAQLAYIESESFVRYLADIYGSGSIITLLDAYQEGASCSGAIQRVYQRSLSQLEAEWIRSLPGSKDQFTGRIIGGLAMIVLLSAIGLVFWTRLRKRWRQGQNGT